MTVHQRMKPARAGSRARRRPQNLALSSGVFLMCGLLCEVVLRIAGYGNLEIYEPDARLYWRLKPNQDCYTKVDRRPVHINSRGTRGSEFAGEKPANTIRSLSLGDSRTFGWGLADDETYSSRLEKSLQQFLESAAATNGAQGVARSVARRVEVINAGVNAWSYPQMMVFYRDVAVAWQPDFVILADANLWTQFSEMNDPEFVRKFMSRVRLKNFLRRFALYHYVVEVRLKEFYERNRTKFIPVDPRQDQLFKDQQQKDPDAAFREAIEGICRTAGTNQVPIMLVFLPTLDELQSMNPSPVLRAKRVVSAKLAVPLVDLSPDLAAGKALYLDADPVHLNAQGNEIVARRLFDIISAQLRR